MAAINPDYTPVRNPWLKSFLQYLVGLLFSTSAGHDHDGVNSKTLSPAAVIENDAVTSVKILDLNVTEAKIAANAVTAGKIGTGAVVEAKLGTGAVTADKIGAGAVVEAKLGAGAVTADKIGAGAVVAAKLGAEAVETAKIKDANVTAGKLASNAVETAKIKDANVTLAKLAADARLLNTAITDPGDAGAIPVTGSGSCSLVSAAAETRTLAAPTYVGQQLSLCCKTYAGDVVLTAAAAIDSTGNNTLTFGAAGDFIALVGVELGAAKVWRILSNDGVALSIV